MYTKQQHTKSQHTIRVSIYTVILIIDNLLHVRLFSLEFHLGRPLCRFPLPNHSLPMSHIGIGNVRHFYPLLHKVCKFFLLCSFLSIFLFQCGVLYIRSLIRQSASFPFCSSFFTLPLLSLPHHFSYSVKS